MKKLIIAIILITVVFFIAGCSIAQNPENVGKTNEIIMPIDYGNGVYYFSCRAAKFGNSLSFFIKQNPSLKFAGMAGDGTGIYGLDIGYWVIFEKK